jgi:hypothetical protein
MKILKTSGDTYRLTMAPQEARIFVNGMKEAEKSLDAWEFPSRFGAKLDDVKAPFLRYKKL